MFRFLTLAGLFFVGPLALGQPQTILFDTIEPDTKLVAGTGVISLQGDTEVTGHMEATGELETASGVRFPDGTIQITAAEAQTGATANRGLYANRIADFSPPNAYTEVCFKASAVQFDIHSVGEPTAGGNCLPGDIGWIIERFERAGTATWTDARIACLLDGMRLPEPFEWQVGCDNEALFALDAMTDDWEWASNTAQLDTTPGIGLVGASVFGNGACSAATRGALGTGDSSRNSLTVRCAH